MEEKNKKAKPRDLDRELKRIYSDQDGALPDFTRLDGKPSSRLRSLLFAIFGGGLLIAAATWAGIFLFSRATGFTGEGVELSVQSDGSLTSGSEEQLVIAYKNHERIPLARASIQFKAPDGFQVTGSDPATAASGSWDIGSIPSGGEGQVKVRGYVKRELNAALTFQAELDYKPADFNSDFQKVASHTAVVQDAVLSLSATGTDEMTPGDEASYLLSYENRSDQPLEHMRLIVDPLDGLLPDGSDPKQDADVALQWTFPKIEAHAKGTVKITGTFAATARGQKTLQAHMGFVGDNGLIDIADANTTTNVLKSNLNLTLLVNGSDKPPIVSFGDMLYFAVRYENAGDVSLKDVTLSAALPSEPDGKTLLDWVSLKDDLNGKRTGSTIVWTKKELPALTALSPGDKGEIDFSVPLIRAPFSDVKTSAYVVHAVASATIGKAGTVSGSRQVDTTPLDVTLQSDTSFEAYGRYFTDDGTPVGSGPMPPQVGQKTVYRITWVIQNSLHELTDLTATTVLPQGVKWTGIDRQVDAGSLTFDETGRKATWRLNRMPTSVKAVTVNFDVEFSPEAEDAGKIADLTGDNRLEAFDKDVGTVILKTVPAIGTDLLGDQNAAGKGVVRE